MSAPGSSLRPGWSKGSSGGRGFQPPPTVADRGEKTRSGSWESHERGSSNKFAALDDDDDEGFIPVSSGKAEDKPNSRSEAFRSSFGRQSSTGGSSKPSGRSLADLAARVPEAPGPGRKTASGRFYRSSSSDLNGAEYKPDPKVIRFTREKLLSMRATPSTDALPDWLSVLAGSVILSETPQDPVCYDPFDSEEVWESFRERRLSANAKVEAPPPGTRPESTVDPRRRPAPSGGRWQRGVALPPPEEAARKRRDENAENPDELWDDPGGATSAASDFSSFGAMPMDDGEVFDFDKMAEATRKLDEELHGSIRSDASGNDPRIPSKSIDTTRPLASAGMTIASGSGDDVNVFEDFDDPAQEDTQNEPPTVRGATEDPTASSRLMAMIGVDPPKNGETNPNGLTGIDPWGVGGAPISKAEPAVPSIDPIFGSIGGLSLNPWGGGVPGPSAPVAPEGGVDLTGRLEVLAAEQKARERQIELEKRAQQEAELIRRRQQDEVQRRALAQRQAEEQARAVAMRQQQATEQSQVELVLMERICSILENSWGRSDLVSILTTLHAEDSRVIPLLSNVDALRALIARSPQRVALRRDPSFSGEMTVLLLTNAQWQQQQQAQARHQEELRRRQLEEEALAQSQARSAVQINPDLPWFYSDPQNNIQGPFRGEEMRQWLEAGYFKGDLPICQQPSGPFHPLSVLFPDLHMAFKAVPPEKNENIDMETEKKALEEKIEQEKAEATKREIEARKSAERERAEAERKLAEETAALEAAQEAETRKAATVAKAKNGGNESSTQLKMILGLSGNQSPEADIAETPVQASKKPVVEKKSQKGSQKAQIKVGEESTLGPKAAQGQSLQQKPSAGAWGGAANANPKKSISEIQQEEARRAALEAAQGGGQRQPSSGWANIAAGTQGWTSGVVKQVGAPAAGAVPATLRPAQAPRPGSNPPSLAGANDMTLSQQNRSSSTASGATPAEDFGATMSPSLEKWCKEQMQILNGSDDLTLVGFCMTLTDANEIRQYLQAYLGNVPKVNSFATEFINRRGLGSKQEEWETPGSAKKGRKKKAGAR